MQALILADGAFPVAEKRLNLLRQTPNLICCDGAVEKLVAFGLEPLAIVGDMDSISEAMRLRFAGRLFPSADQETNDLTKAVHYCLNAGFDDVAILGATGLREDHTLGNVALLADFAARLRSVCLLTDYGRMDAVLAGVQPDEHRPTGLDAGAPEVCATRDGRFTVARFGCYAGQQVSVFALDPTACISSLGLKYPLEDRSFTSWWQGTLNEATGEQFSLSFDKGGLIVYRVG